VENTFRWVLLTAIAPIAWGSTYFVTHQFLPADHPLWGAVIRALPAGLLLFLVRRRRPHGSWWWRSLVIGTLTMGAFFALVYVAAQVLTTGVAATVMATSPVVMMLMAWAMISERPHLLSIAGAALGIAGVALLVVTGGGALDPLGIVASIGAMLMSSLGYVLAKRWSGSVDLIASTSWQLIAGGLVLLPLAVVVEGAPPVLDAPALLGFGYVTVIATALAFVAWFAGLRHLDTGTVGLVGLLNPVTGVALGVLLAGERLAAPQLLGAGLVLVGILLGQPVVRARLAARRAPATPVRSPV
jgi:probable blue pigment (indigoidine) exporter